MLCLKCYHDIGAGSRVCPACGRSPGGGEDDREAGTPWRRRRGLGTVAALGATLQESLFRPARFFRSVAGGGGTGGALWYAVLVGTLSILVGILWGSAFGGAVFCGAEGGAGFPGGGTLAAALLVLPPAILLSVVGWSIVLHLCLALLGAARSGLGATLRVVAYAQSASAFFAFPFVGVPLGIVWGAGIQIIGLREAHRTSTIRALLGWLLPFALLGIVGFMSMAAVMVLLSRVWTDMGGFLEMRF